LQHIVCMRKRPPAGAEASTVSLHKTPAATCSYVQPALCPPLSYLLVKLDWKTRACGLPPAWEYQRHVSHSSWSHSKARHIIPNSFHVMCYLSSLDCKDYGRLCLKCDGTRAETRFRLSAKRTSPFKSAGASVQSTTSRRAVHISLQGLYCSCKPVFCSHVTLTGYPLQSLASPSLLLPCVTVCHHISTGFYLKQSPSWKLTVAHVAIDPKS
jgi:hypothetical protein